MADESLTAPARAVYTKRNFRASVDVNDYELKEGWLEKKGKLLAGWQKLGDAGEARTSFVTDSGSQKVQHRFGGFKHI